MLCTLHEEVEECPASFAKEACSCISHVKMGDGGGIGHRLGSNRCMDVGRVVSL